MNWTTFGVALLSSVAGVLYVGAAIWFISFLRDYIYENINSDNLGAATFFTIGMLVFLVPVCVLIGVIA